jgi:hypothetical protein
MLKSLLLSMVGFVLFIHAYTRTTNVIPGEADYPTLSKEAADFITVTFHIPASVHPRFTLFYAGAFGRKTYPKPSLCHYAVRTGSATEYTVVLNEYWKSDPLTLTFQSQLPDELGHSKDIKSYSASIPVDRYEAGRCHWQFDQLAYSLEDDPTRLVPVFYYANDDQSESVGPFRFLCTRQDATRETRQREVCGGPRIEYATWLYQRPEKRFEFLNDPQAYVQKRRVASGSGVSVEFHDIDNVVVESPPIPIS